MCPPGSAARPLLRRSLCRGFAPGRSLSTGAAAGGLGQSPGHRPPGVFPAQNASEHLPLLLPARPGMRTNVLGVSGKAVSLNGIKLTVLEDPQHSDCPPGEPPAGSSGLRSLCLGTAPAAGRACTRAAGAIGPIPRWRALSGLAESPPGGLGAQGRAAAPCDVS